MAGKINAGLGTLIGNAGEYYVVAELLKRGIIAALAPRNSPDFDILATKGTQAVRIRVKTKSEEYDIWQWSAKKDGVIFRGISQLNEYSVWVNLTADHHLMDYFILPTSLLDTWLDKDFQTWLKTFGKKGQPHDPSNPKRNLPYPEYREKLEPYRNNWSTFWDAKE
jgi:hypothetical protein